MPSDTPVSTPHRVTAVRFALAAAALATAPLAAQPLAPVGAQAQVNHVIQSGQNLPDVASDALGNFVVVWESFVSAGNDASARSIQARRYLANGTPAGAQFQVNTQTLGEQVGAAVSMAPDGRFAIAWTSDEGGGGPVDFDIRARLYAANGTPAGSDFLVNTFDVGEQRDPDLAWAGDLGFGVVWESDDDTAPTFDWNVVARFYDGTGVPVTGEMQLNTLGGYQLDPALAGHPSGNFVAAWESDASAGTDVTTTSIQAVIVGSGPEVQVNDHPPVAGDDNPTVACAQDGTILVAWESTGSSGNDNSLASIQARLYDAGGNPGPVFQANSWITDAQRFPSAAFLPDGRFLLGWHSFGSFGNDASFASIQVRAFAADGTPFGNDLQANTYTNNNQQYAAVTADGRGGLVAVWESYGSPGSDQDSSSIQARRFSLDLIFLGGFESGDFSGWSQVQP
ncbi:MAG: hypothetical protein F9K18_11000 [Thermoanaerobaculia bacterium]|nr:MAG: hypothetical protein F9K18_11000 [Thermoanaerobaculia bacterium]